MNAKIRVRASGAGSPWIPLRCAFYLILGARDQGVPVTFSASGPDAQKAIRVISMTCADPPDFERASLIYCGLGGRQEKLEREKLAREEG